MILKNIFTRFVSFTIIIAMLFPMFTKLVVAAKDDVGNYTITSITTLPKNPFYPDWKKAIFDDGLSWNAFHNAVQSDIVGKNSAQMETKIEDAGRADITKEIDGWIFIWEVKPADYGINPEKEEKAFKQLKNYVDQDKEIYKTGNSNIRYGETSISKIVDKGTVTEYVTYKIKYQNAQNGLILYHFTRNVDKTVVNPVPAILPAPQRVPGMSPSKETAEREVRERGLEVWNPSPALVPGAAVAALLGAVAV